MTDLRLKGTCEHCRYWKASETNPMVGRCPVLGIMLFPKGDDMEIVDEKLQVEVAIVASVDSPPVSEVLQVRTGQYFGCIHFDPRRT